MSRYIDAEWLENNAKEYSLGYYEADEWATPLNVLDSAPSIDIVRCKECKYSDESLVEGCVYCNETDRAMDENGFCHKGEREGE